MLDKNLNLVMNFPRNSSKVVSCRNFSLLFCDIQRIVCARKMYYAFPRNNSKGVSYRIFSFCYFVLLKGKCAQECIMYFQGIGQKYWAVEICLLFCAVQQKVCARTYVFSRNSSKSWAVEIYFLLFFCSVQPAESMHKDVLCISKK